MTTISSSSIGTFPYWTRLRDRLEAGEKQKDLAEEYGGDPDHHLQAAEEAAGYSSRQPRKDGVTRMLRILLCVLLVVGPSTATPDLNNLLVIYTNGSITYPPVGLGSWLRATHGSYQDQPTQGRSLVSMGGVTLMHYSARFEPQGVPSYDLGFTAGTEVGAQITSLYELHFTGFMVSIPARAYFLQDSQFALGFWNAVYLSQHADFLHAMMLRRAPVSYERGYAIGYADASAGVTQLYDLRITAEYKRGQENGYDRGYREGDANGYARGYQSGFNAFVDHIDVERLLAGAEVLAAGSRDVWVHSYMRRDGTLVRGHYRSTPD